MKGFALQTSVIVPGIFLILGSGCSGGTGDSGNGASPGTPENVTALSTYQGTLLSWDESSNAASYEVCYATQSIGSYSICTSYSNGAKYSVGDDTSVLIGSLTAGQTYYFRVIAENSQGIQGSASVNVQATPSLGLNDTGITDCREIGSVNVTCPSSAFPDQDADYGLDASAMDNSNGHAGFNMTRMNASGTTVADDAADWSCVKDNVTGLTWEVKRGSNNGGAVIGNDGLHDADDSYTWYNTDANSNAGTVGDSNSALNACYGYNASDSSTYCNTEAFIKRVNNSNYCGVSNWRLPTREELNSIVNYNEVGPAVDLALFPSTPLAVFWSASSVYSSPSSGSQAWGIDFNYGGSAKTNKTESHHVRLVSDGE